ncbi:MAG: LuxR C-terminal-related transcriptional regulator [Cyanobacteria bacterium J06621_11]
METIEKYSLHMLFEAIAQAQTKRDLSQTTMHKVGTYFAAKRWRLWFMHELPTENFEQSNGQSDGQVDGQYRTKNKEKNDLIKRAISLETNPVLRYLVERHTAVHDEVVLPPGVWKTICPRADHGHVMVGPLIHQSQLIGGIAVTRHRTEPAFSANDLADLSALSLHFSTHFALLNQAPLGTPNSTYTEDIKPAAKTLLTPREMQIAKLVAQGLTNKKVGAALWISENSVKQALKRMFRKLKVSSRAEMVARLAADNSGL